MALSINNCGVASFILSAGLGALSQTFLGSIRERSEEKLGSDGQQQPSLRVKPEDFEDVKKLGQGAFGKVHLVRHKQTQDMYAMKLMDKSKFQALKITSKAQSEQYILKTTRHPFIVSLHFAFQGKVVWADPKKTMWVLVMEYCPNGDLQSAVCKHGKPGLPLVDCARLAGEVILAIEHLHSIQVIFRDLKPENVVLDGSFRAKVTDFGLAKKLSDAQAKTMCGSHGYVAPEILANTGEYTYAVDLYSYGVMMYVLVSGGEEKKSQRLPPMSHRDLKRTLKNLDRDESKAWARQSVGALGLINVLTDQDPKVRSTATEVKGHRFFTQQLNHPVDSLLAEKGPFTLGSKPAPAP